MTRVQFKLILKRLNNLFGQPNERHFPSNSTEYEWDQNRVLLGLDSNSEFGTFGNGTCPAHLQMDFTSISQETLDKYLEDAVTAENVVDIFEAMYREMSRNNRLYENK